MMRKLTRCFVLSILAILTLSIIVFADQTPRVIRVGYIDNYGTINSPLVHGSEGYGYEYLNTIIDYTAGDYELEFVQCSWENAYAMLRSRQIDLLGPVTANVDIADEFSYMKNPIGNNTLFLTSTGSETIDTNTYDRLNGSKIGVSTNDYGSSNLYHFLSKYDIQATVLLLDNEDTSTVFDEYHLDYYIVSAFQLSTTEDFNVLAQIETSPVYYISTPENQSLLNDLDYGYQQILDNHYLYEERLYLKYYDYKTRANNYVSAEEYTILQNQRCYYVGVQDLHSPFSKTTDTGDLSGLSKDFIEILSDNAGIILRTISINEDTPQSELDKIDFYLFPTSTTSNQQQSPPYLTVPLLLVEHNATVDNASTVGILTYYGIESMKDNGRIMSREVFEYNSLEQMKNEFNAGIIDSMITTTASLNYIRREIEESDYLSTTLSNEMALTVTYAENFPQNRIDILNKIISNLDTTELNYSLLKASSATEIPTFTSWMKDHPLFMLSVIAFVAACFILSEYLKRRAIDKQFNFDALTGLYSQHKFNVEVEKRLKAEPLQAYQLVSIDIDNFKYINEIYGYEVDTQILKRFSLILRDAVNDDVILSRVYADYFLLFGYRAPNYDDFQQYLDNAANLNNELSSLLGTSYNFSFSVGLYNLPNNKGELSFMIDCVNLAREQGKTTVGTTIHTFSEEVNIERVHNNEIAANMERALETGEFILHYQSKIDLNTEKLVGAEALVRWERNGKLVPPNSFIPVFEKNGFIVKLDFYVLDQVCLFLKTNAARNMPKISVNLSGVTVAYPNVVNIISQILAQHNIQPSQLDIEITETAFVETDHTLDTISQIEDLGFTVSLDDFGAGISSLNRLKNLNIDTLKIDREFIVDYLGNKKGAVILKSVLDMANSLQIETVAEGIETREQLESLRLYGCTVGQGYYFSRPVSGDTFLQMYFDK